MSPLEGLVAPLEKLTGRIDALINRIGGAGPEAAPAPRAVSLTGATSALRDGRAT